MVVDSLHETVALKQYEVVHFVQNKVVGQRLFVCTIQGILALTITFIIIITLSYTAELLFLTHQDC